MYIFIKSFTHGLPATKLMWAYEENRSELLPIFYVIFLFLIYEYNGKVTYRSHVLKRVKFKFVAMIELFFELKFHVTL